MMISKTASSNRAWLVENDLKVQRYLRHFHRNRNKRRFRDADSEDILFYLLKYADEGRKLIENLNLTDAEKYNCLLDFIIFQPQITCAILGDQRYGKDATICKILEDANKRRVEVYGLLPCRIVTLNNVRAPLFVKPDDMYFTFKDIPSGTDKSEVWIYTSEIETLIPARETTGEQNKLFSFIEGTLAQNHQKLFGCIKLASKVDINFIRSLNVKIFKYISPDKLNVEGVERENFLSPLARWHLPDDKNDKSKTLFCFDSNIFTVSLPLPVWWSAQYSEQFNDVPDEQVIKWIVANYTDKISLTVMSTAVSQRFRKNWNEDKLSSILIQQGIIKR